MTPRAGVRGVTLYVWRTLHDVTPLLVKLVKTKKKMSPPKLQWVFGPKTSVNQKKVFEKKGLRQNVCGFSLRMCIETQ